MSKHARVPWGKLDSIAAAAAQAIRCVAGKSLTSAEIAALINEHGSPLELNLALDRGLTTGVLLRSVSSGRVLYSVPDEAPGPALKPVSRAPAARRLPPPLPEAPMTAASAAEQQSDGAWRSVDCALWSTGLLQIRDAATGAMIELAPPAVRQLIDYIDRLAVEEIAHV